MEVGLDRRSVEGVAVGSYAVEAAAGSAGVADVAGDGSIVGAAHIEVTVVAAHSAQADPGLDNCSTAADAAADSRRD